MSYLKFHGLIILIFSAAAETCALLDNWGGCAIFSIGTFAMFAMGVLRKLDES